MAVRLNHTIVAAHLRPHSRARSHHWADPHRSDPGRINEWDGGRGVYFDDPNGHLLEVITRPYGSGGTTSPKVHPLFASS